MNKYLILSGTAALLLLLQACADDDFRKPTPVPEGSEISFGANLDRETQTRTYYGDETVLDGGVTVWPIYWNNGDMTKDEVFIYSPQALNGRNQAVFTADAEAPSTDGVQTPAPLVKNGVHGIQTSNADSYDFYALYPGSLAKDSQAEGSVIKGTLPANQTAKYIDSETHADVVPDPAPGDVHYVTAPDMRCCLMTGMTKGVESTALSNPVKITFSPFATVLDITIKGPDNNVFSAARVTSVTITETNGNKIAGDFSVDFSSEKPTCIPDANATDRVVIDTKGLDQHGNYVGIPLCTAQSSLNVKAFLLPNTDVSNLQITVNVVTRQYSKMLNMDGFQPSQIHKVSLPVMDNLHGEFDYSTWISQLDPRIYISELSLPGSALTYNAPINGIVGGNMQCQTLNIPEQFNAGIRVFQGHVNESLQIVTSSGKACVKADNSPFTISDAAGYLVREMRGSHSDEFCVLMISDWIQGVTNEKLAQLYSTLHDMLVNPAYADYFVTDVNPNTTIADVKGKIILKLQLNGSSNGSGYAGANSTLTKIQGWSALNGTKALFNWFTETANSVLFYCPMSFGNVGSFTFTPASDSKPVITQVSAGISVEAAELVAETGTDAKIGNADPTTLPTNMSTGMWYIYSENAEAGYSYDGVLTNIHNVVDAIKDTYRQSEHNKYYLVYCGGTGGQKSVSEVTSGLANEWNTAVGNNWGAMPYGWVLFNEVSNEKQPIKGYIEKVIENNNREDFILARDRSVSVIPERPTGDVQGTTPGGSLF